MNTEKKVLNYIEENKMLAVGESVILGVSGGADSMTMLDIMEKGKHEKQWSLYVVHVNHGIRGDEALRDQMLVEKYCAEKGIPCAVYQYSVPQVAKELHMSEEEAGRYCREKACEQLKHDYGLPLSTKIALAHNQNDQAETVLHHLVRGAALRGMAGIRPLTEYKMHPILPLSRKEIEAYCQENHIAYVNDSTNQQTKYTRNKIRHNILPYLEQELNPEAISHIAVTANLFREVDEYLSYQAKQIYSVYSKKNDWVMIPFSILELPAVLQETVIMEALKGISQKRKDISAVHIKMVLQLFRLQNSRKADLPYEMEAIRVYEGVKIRKKETPFSVEHHFSVKLIPDTRWQEINLGNSILEYRVFPYSGEIVEQNHYTKWLDYDKIKSDVFVRQRENGDYLILDETGKHKKLNRYFIDLKIPVEKRAVIPLLACEKEILWVIGGRINAQYKINQYTRNVLEVKYKEDVSNERSN